MGNSYFKNTFKSNWEKCLFACAYICINFLWYNTQETGNIGYLWEETLLAEKGEWYKGFQLFLLFEFWTMRILSCNIFSAVINSVLFFWDFYKFLDFDFSEYGLNDLNNFICVNWLWFYTDTSRGGDKLSLRNKYNDVIIHKLPIIC